MSNRELLYALAKVAVRRKIGAEWGDAVAPVGSAIIGGLLGGPVGAGAGFAAGAGLNKLFRGNVITPSPQPAVAKPPVIPPVQTPASPPTSSPSITGPQTEASKTVTRTTKWDKILNPLKGVAGQ